MLKIETEKQLCEMFIGAHTRPDYLYKEVYMPYGGRADVIYKEHNIVVIYEMKLQLSLDLLEQCIARREYGHFVYAVVPEPKRPNHFMFSLFEDYGVGVLYVEKRSVEERSIKNRWPYINVNVLHEKAKPKFNRTPKDIVLYEENKTEVAGVKHAGVTPFSLMVKSIVTHLESPNTIKTLEECFKNQTYYGTLKQFKTNIYQWCKRGVITEFHLLDGKLHLGVYVEKQEPEEQMNLFENGDV